MALDVFSSMQSTSKDLNPCPPLYTSTGQYTGLPRIQTAGLSAVGGHCLGGFPAALRVTQFIQISSGKNSFAVS